MTSNTVDEMLSAIAALRNALEVIASSARGGGPLARDRDADTLRGIEIFVGVTLQSLAIADTHPKDGDVKQAPLVSGGGAGTAIAQKGSQ